MFQVSNPPGLFSRRGTTQYLLFRVVCFSRTSHLKAVLNRNPRSYV